MGVTNILDSHIPLIVIPVDGMSLITFLLLCLEFRASPKPFYKQKPH